MNSQQKYEQDLKDNVNRVKLDQLKRLKLLVYLLKIKKK